MKKLLFLIIPFLLFANTIKYGSNVTPHNGDLYISNDGSTYEVFSCSSYSTSCLSSLNGNSLNFLYSSINYNYLRLDFGIYIHSHGCIVGYKDYGDCFLKKLCSSGFEYNASLEKCVAKCPDETTFKKMVLDKCKNFDYVQNATCSTSTGDINITCKSCSDIFNMQKSICDSLHTIIKDGNYNCSVDLNGILNLDFNISDSNCIPFPGQTFDNNSTNNNDNNKTNLSTNKDNNSTNKDNNLSNNETNLSLDFNSSSVNSVKNNTNDINTNTNTNNTNNTNNDNFKKLNVSKAAGQDEKKEPEPDLSNSYGSIKGNVSTFINNMQNDFDNAYNTISNIKSNVTTFNFSLPSNASHNDIKIHIFGKDVTFPLCEIVSKFSSIFYFIFTLFIIYISILIFIKTIDINIKD